MKRDEMIELLRRSFKKLKANVYLDKTKPILREKLVRYEKEKSDKNVEASLSDLAKKFCNDEDWKSYKRDLLNSIVPLTFPKELKKLDTNVIFNWSPKNAVVTKPQYFFDSDVEVQILGVAWIIKFGRVIDKKFSDNIYGNRLREYKSDSDSSPYLFYPYFSKYEKWRDQGLERAKKLLEDGKDVIVLTMDVKNYFHSVDLNEVLFSELYKDCIQENPELKQYKRLHEFIFEVMKKYSSFFEDGRRIFLPIGFLPSNILANWYLEYFDKAIINVWNPSYYGRYVDDILIVDKVEREGKVRDILSNNNVKVNKVADAGTNNTVSKETDADNDDYNAERELLRHFLYNPAWKEDRHVLKENYSCPCGTEKKKDTYCQQCNKKATLVYDIQPSILNIPGNPNPELRIQNKKVGVYFFDNKGSKTLITCFQKNIARNSSVFNFLPEDGEAIEYEDYSGIFKLEYEDTINKWSGVKGISLDKFELSKFLGRQFKIGTLIRDKIESKFLNDLNKIFDNPTLIENYRSWESILNYFVASQYLNRMKMFIKKIGHAIDEIEEQDLPKVKGAFSTKDTLNKYLSSVLGRVLALVWGNMDKYFANEEFKDIKGINFKEIGKVRRYFYKSRMINKYLIPGSLDSIVPVLEEFEGSRPKEVINLTSFEDVFKLYNMKKSDIQDEYKYYPYIVTPQEMLFDNFIQHTIDPAKPLNMDVKLLKDAYYKKNFSINNKESNNDALPELDSRITKEGIVAFKVGNKRMKEVRVAVANVTIDDKTLVNVLRGRPNRSSKRYNCLAKVINQAIKEKADIIVMPEAYVPMEWIPILAQQSAKSQIALVFGVEHITNRDRKVFNYTAVILPYSKEQEYRFAHIVLHRKNYFAPVEAERIRGYRMEPVQAAWDGVEEKSRETEYELIVWNDLWFTTLCCYELASIHDRCKLYNYIDMLIAVEWNKDVHYFSSIIESLSRDLHCYCVQVNSSYFGDNRITQPASTEQKDLVRFKGGSNETIVIETIKVDSLRRFQEMEYNLQKAKGNFKPTPPHFNKDWVTKKISGTFWEEVLEERNCH